MTIGDIEMKVREFVKDTHEGAYRYAPWLIVGAIFDGLRVLRMIRPETRYEGIRVVRQDWPYITMASNKADIDAAREMPWPVDPRWEQAVRYFAAARCFETDAADTVNAARAAECQKTFTALAAT